MREFISWPILPVERLAVANASFARVKVLAFKLPMNISGDWFQSKIPALMISVGDLVSCGELRMLKNRATAYSIMYDVLRQRRSSVDHFFSLSQQTSTQAIVAYIHARFSTVSGADLVIDPDWLMDTG